MAEKELKPALNHQIASVDELIPYARNARVHTDEHVLQLAGSIREFGFNNPVLTDQDNSIIAGHGRVLAAKKLGLTEIPVVVLSHFTEAQKKAFILADNKLHDNSSFNYEMLQIELDELKEMGFDLETAGFESFELAESSSVDLFDELESGVFIDHLRETSESFVISFSFPKEAREEFDSYFQLHSKAELEERIIELVSGKQDG